MFKIQFCNPAGRMVTAQLSSRAEIQKLADKARREMPEIHELRLCEVAADEITGDFVWADCTADFAR